MTLEERIKEIEWRLSQYMLTPSFWIDGNHYNDGDLALVNDWVEKNCYEAIFLKEACYLKESYEVIKELQSELERYKSLWETNCEESKEIIAELREVIEDKKRLTREIDIAINGKNAAKQASLCDILGQVRNMNKDEWQPIETAPKDGTNILLYAEGRIIEGWYYLIEGRNSGYWKVATLSPHGCGCCADDLENPTHWKPLPKPPEQNH